MKIALTTESFYPNISGVAVFTQTLAEKLLEAGEEVIVLSPSLTGETYQDQYHGVTVYRLKSKLNPFRKGFRTVVGQKKVIWNILDKFQPDVIHLQDPGGASSKAVAYAKKQHIPIVGTYHFSLDLVLRSIPLNQKITQPLSPLIIRYLNNFFNKCDLLTCPTETIRQDLLRQGIKQPIQVISNGIKLDRFAAGPSLARPECLKDVPLDQPVLLHLGRLDRDKNIPEFLETIRLVSQETKVCVLVVGDGVLRTSMVKWAKNQGLQDSFIFTGAIPHSDPLLPALYGHSSIFVIPSTAETQSIVTMEAMTAGLPVVAANAGALPELVEDGKNGYLITPDNPAEYARKIIHLLRHPELRQQMGAQGQEKILVHNLEHTITTFLKLYRKLIEIEAPVTASEAEKLAPELSE